MKRQYTVLELVNKVQVVIPWILLLKCDGTAGSESLITVGVDFALIFFLTVLEADYRTNRKLLPALAISSLCAFLTVLFCALELVCFLKYGSLKGDIAFYGIPNTLICLTGLFFSLVWLSAYVDTFARSKVR